jgi:hypothetical protein
MKYDDFALPSLENIENMAKAYAKMEKQFLQESGNCDEDYSILQKIYNNLFCSNQMLKKICSVNNKSRKFLNTYELATKLKVEF